jgi:hypothetical protein
MELGYASKEDNLKFIASYRQKYNLENMPDSIKEYFDINMIDGLGLHYKLSVKEDVDMADMVNARKVLEDNDWPTAVRLGKTKDKKGYVEFKVPVAIEHTNLGITKMKMQYHRESNSARIQYQEGIDKDAWNTRDYTPKFQVRNRWYINGKAIRTDKEFKKVQIARLKKVDNL